MEHGAGFNPGLVVDEVIYNEPDNEAPLIKHNC
jgi:hypothetical protein